MTLPTDQRLPGLAPIARVQIAVFLMPDGSTSHVEVTGYDPNGRLHSHWAKGASHSSFDPILMRSAYNRFDQVLAEARQDLIAAYEPSESPQPTSDQ